MSKCCYKCPKRTQTCHSTCKDYADEVAENEKKKKAAREYKLMPFSRLKKLYTKQKTKN